MFNKFFVALMLCMMLCGCALHPVNINFFTSAIVNSDEHYRSLPITVYLYQLKSREQFLDADFDELTQKNQQILHGSLITKNQIVLYPGDRKSIRINLTNQTRYIGVVGVFRRSNQWKSIMKVKRNTPLIPSTIHVSVIRNRIYIRPV